MKPKLLMLDEPAAGLSPVNVDNLNENYYATKRKIWSYSYYYRAYFKSRNGYL